MAYNPEILKSARRTLDQRRTAAQTAAAGLRADMIARCPRLLEIEQEMAGSAQLVVRAVLDRQDVEQVTAEARDRNLALQEEMAAILRDNGVNARNFEPQYSCPYCEDTGYIRGRMCGCLTTLLKEEACRRLSGITPMQLTDFDSMDLSYYSERPDPELGTSPRDHMQSVVRYCRRYAENFHEHSGSLLLTGPTGVGKTHLSLAIAKIAAEKGFDVVYGPIQTLFHRLEKEHFGRAEGDSEDVLLSCDLLILDDVGTEFSGPFYTACLYNIINTRLLEQRPVIISTNLDNAQIQERYGDQIASRIVGAYTPLVCVGRDIRQQRRLDQLRQ